MELLEREHFLAVLGEGYKKAMYGEGHCFFVMGEAGIGKSLLVKAFLKLTEERSKVYVALCDSLFTPRPLGPLYDFALQISGDFAERISAIISRAALFAAFAQELTQHDKPAVIIIEDIHWADEATLDFIKFFARRISRTRCLFILTCRDNEVTHQHPLRNVFGELPSGTFTRLQLTPLSKDAVQKLAGERGYNGEDVYHITGGNPFYVSEIIASYSTGIPDNVKDAVLSVYNRQQDDTKNVWQVLSIMPEGLEYSWLNKIDTRWQAAIETCLNYGILLIRNNRTVFKHELFRRAIEASLSPFRRLQLNKNILQLFLERFKEAGAIERIVHYAKNAAENKLVVQYAPLAAQQAASVGAHTEAAKLYLAAIEYTEVKEADDIVQLYEAYTYECYLTNQISEAIIYQTKALKIWQEKGEHLRIGNSLRFLSRLWWYQGHREEAESYGLQAIEVFNPLPASKAKAMAFSNLSQLKMLSEEVEDCIKWGNLAIEMAKAINDEETLCHALNNVGTAKWVISAIQEDGKQLLEKSLKIALQHSFHEHAARAYTNLISRSITAKDYETAQKYLAEGLQYCEERDLHSWIKYQLSWKARMLLETGDWEGAGAVTDNLLANASQPGIIKIGALVVAATITVRKGEGNGLAALHEAKTLAFVSKEHQRIVPVIIAYLEYEWITGTAIIADDELNKALSLIQSVNNIHLNVEAAFWLRKARPDDTRIENLYNTYENLRKSDRAIAAIFQKRSKCPYEQALLLFDGSEDDKRKCLSVLQHLGANAVCQKLKRDMRASGIKKIPRGIRTNTKLNPAQLTARELDILALLKTGAQNKEIASALFISPKTVDHHISSILFKLDASSRTKAVGEAEKLGILK